MGDERLPSCDPSALYVALSRLAADRGVWSNDLSERLSGELRAYWGIDQSERDLVTLRKYAVVNLRKHIGELEPVSAGKADGYDRSVRVSFNLYDDVDLREQTQRLVENGCKIRVIGVSGPGEKSSRDWLEHAIEQIERSLVSGNDRPDLPEEFPRFRLSAPKPTPGRSRHENDSGAMQISSDYSPPTTTVSDQVSELSADWPKSSIGEDQSNDQESVPQAAEQETLLTTGETKQSKVDGHKRIPSAKSHRAAVLAMTAVIVTAVVSVYVFGSWPLVSRGALSPQASHSQISLTPSPSQQESAQQVPPEKALLVTTTSLNDLNLGYQSIIPQDKINQAKGFADRLTTPTAGSNDEPWLLYVDEIKAGAYAYRGVTVQVQLQAASDNEWSSTTYDRSSSKSVTQLKVKWSVRRLPPKELTQSGISLISRTRQARTTLRMDRHSSPPSAYVSLKAIQRTLVLKVAASTGAYDFNIAIDYEFNGQRFTQMAKLNQDGPDLLLRATADHA